MWRSLSLSLFLAVGASLSVPQVAALDNGRSVEPHLGFNTWNFYGCDINEEIVLTAGRQLKQTGLSDKGYKIVWIDDCWQADERDPETGEIPAHPEKFPSGLKGVVDELHAMGLEAGIYSSAGVKTCGGHIGSLDHEEVDAKSWAAAGFDSLKYDNCFNQGRFGTAKLSFDRYNAMSKAINATGRPMTMALCNWGEDQPSLWATETWNSWRISGDIFNTFDREDERCPCNDMLDCKFAGYHCSVKKIINYAAPFGQKARPGAWNDLDMLQVGNGGLTRDEEITHFSLWAIVKSPLLLGNDMATISNQTIAIAGNSDVLALNQDKEHLPANRLTALSNDQHQFWVGKLEKDAYVLAILNFGRESFSAKPSFEDIFIDTPSDAQKSYRVYDLWAGVDFDDPSRSTDAPEIEGSPLSNAVSNVTVAQHGTRLFKMVPT